MATKTTKESSVKTTTTAAKRGRKASAPAADTTESIAVAAGEIQNNTPVVCKNGTRGNLIYKSTRNVGYEVEWSEFGEEQLIEFSELLVMRGSQRRFFEDNWILIDDPEVIKKLGVERFYKNVPSADDFDEIFSLSPDDIKEEISQMSNGMKDSVRIRAKELMKDGELDSRAVIKAIEDALGCEIEV